MEEEIRVIRKRMEEIRVIHKREVKDGMELFVLDSRDLVAEPVDTIPQDTHVVIYLGSLKALKFPGVCTRGRIQPAPEGAMATPLSYFRGPLCACKVFQGVPEVLRPATDAWLAGFHVCQTDIVTIPKGARIRTYTWCESRAEEARFDENFDLVSEEMLPWERKLMLGLQGLSGYYSVVMADTKCIGVWNFFWGSWMGPPTDHRIAKYVGLEFAPVFVPTEPWKTVDDLRKQCPENHMLILRHTYDIGHYVTQP